MELLIYNTSKREYQWLYVLTKRKWAFNNINSTYSACLDQDGNGEILTITDKDVLKIKHDVRGFEKIAVCQHCGKVIRNHTEYIEMHYRGAEQGHDCIDCLHMKAIYTGSEEQTTAAKIDENGNLVQRFVRTTPVQCTWCQEPIPVAKAGLLCKYTQCRKLGVALPFHSIMQDYPKMRETVLTERILIDQGWEYFTATDEGSIYKWGSSSLYAHVIHGRVDHFVAGRPSINIIYSPEYDKFFELLGNRWYSSDLQLLGERLQRTVVQKIKKLYKGCPAERARILEDL